MNGQVFIAPAFGYVSDILAWLTPFDVLISVYICIFLNIRKLRFIFVIIPYCTISEISSFLKLTEHFKFFWESHVSAPLNSFDSWRWLRPSYLELFKSVTYFPITSPQWEVSEKPGRATKPKKPRVLVFLPLTKETQWTVTKGVKTCPKWKLPGFKSVTRFEINRFRRRL